MKKNNDSLYFQNLQVCYPPAIPVDRRPQWNRELRWQHAEALNLHTEVVKSLCTLSFPLRLPQLYGFGTIFNALRLCFDDASVGYENGSWLTSGLTGWNWITWTIAINFAFSGLFVSWWVPLPHVPFSRRQ
jgi:hypothetical protein